MKINTEYLQKLFKDRSLKQHEVASISGISEATISKVKKGHKNMWFDNALVLAEALNEPVLKILAESEQERIIASLAKEAGSLGEWIHLYHEMVELNMDIGEEMDRVRGVVKRRRAKILEEPSSSVS